MTFATSKTEAMATANRVHVHEQSINESRQFSLREMFALVTVVVSGFALAAIHEELPVFLGLGCAVALLGYGILFRRRTAVLVALGAGVGFLLAGWLMSDLLKLLQCDLASLRESRSAADSLQIRHNCVCHVFFLAMILGAASAYWLGRRPTSP